MDNVELSVLLQKYKYILNNAIEKIEDDLPDDLLVERKNLLGNAFLAYDILDPLQELVEIISDDIEALMGRSK